MMAQLPRLKAEWMLMNAQVGALPYMKQVDKQLWYNAQQARIEQSEVSEPIREGGPLMTWNGASLGLAGLKRRVAGVLQEYGSQAGIST